MARTYVKFNGSRNVVEALKMIQAGEAVGYYGEIQLARKGYVEFDSVKGEGRGRPRKVAKLTGKARGLLALAKNWKPA